MKLSRLNELKPYSEDHVFKEILPGQFIYHGGLYFSKPGERSHTNDGTQGKDYHVHNDCEAFIILQGEGEVEINKVLYPIAQGDIIVAEPGEDHHIISSVEKPVVMLWCHASSERNKNQI
jgi:mannose-6-phosphate isomerase-like protein (cupin superfamily)